LGEDFHVDPDLVEAVCLAHDLGHPPFGHAGERTLNDLMAVYGGFEGNAQTLRLLTQTIYQGRRGLNPTRAFLDGVLKYKSLRSQMMPQGGGTPENHFLYDDQADVLDFVIYGGEFPEDLPPGKPRNGFRSIECQIMDWADDTAYSIHDVVDSIHAGFLDGVKIERWAGNASLSADGAAAVERLLRAIRDGKAEPRMERRIGDFIHAATLTEVDGFLSAVTNRHRFHLVLDPVMREECKTYKALAFECVFLTHQLKQLEFKGERMLTDIHGIFCGQYLGRDRPKFNLLPPDAAELIAAAPDPRHKARLLCDYLAGMTDGFAARTYRRLTDPDFGCIVDLV
jgi:dGTPase